MDKCIPFFPFSILSPSEKKTKRLKKVCTLLHAGEAPKKTARAKRRKKGMTEECARVREPSTWDPRNTKKIP